MKRKNYTLNRKIRGTNPKIYNGIKFKSTLEVSCYKSLVAHGFDPKYEEYKYSLWEGPKMTDNVVLYAPLKNKENKGKFTEYMHNQKAKLRDITYTPDFVFQIGNYIFIFDVKGWSNDTYPNKRKMFIKYLQDLECPYIHIFFEPHSVKQIEQACNLIHEYVRENKTTTNKSY